MPCLHFPKPVLTPLVQENARNLVDSLGLHARGEGEQQMGSQPEEGQDAVLATEGPH